MKWVKRIVLAVVVLIVVVIGILYFSLNSIIRNEVQTQANASLAVPTTLGSAHLSLFGGKISLNDLDVGSPPKFTAPQMFTLDSVAVSVHYSDVTKNPIRITQIVIDNPTLIIEQQGMKLNVQALMDQMPQTPKSSTGAAKEPVKLIIDELDVNNAKVNFMPGLPGLSNNIEVPIPSMVLKNIGNADGAGNGAAIKDVVMQTITGLTAQASSAGKLPLDLSAFMTGNLGSLTQQLGGDFSKQLQGITGSVTKGLPSPVGDLINNATSKPSDFLNQGVNDLLGGKKKNP